jgi:hypothetical protein
MNTTPCVCGLIMPSYMPGMCSNVSQWSLYFSTLRSTKATPWVGSKSPDGWDQIPRWAGGWVLHQSPCVSFGFDSQTRGTRENRAPPCVKVRGSSRVPVCDGQTSPHRPRIVVSRSTCPPLSPFPHANSFVIGTAVINTYQSVFESLVLINTQICTNEV